MAESSTQQQPPPTQQLPQGGRPSTQSGMTSTGPPPPGGAATTTTTGRGKQQRNITTGASMYSLSSVTTSGSKGSGPRRTQKPGSPTGSIRSSAWGSVLKGTSVRKQTAGTASHASSSLFGGPGVQSRRRKSRPGVGAMQDGTPAPASVIKDEDGVDVTPKSLLSLKPSALLQHSALADLKLHSSSRASSASESEFGVAQSSFGFTSDTRSTVSSALTTPRTSRSTLTTAGGSEEQSKKQPMSSRSQQPMSSRGLQDASQPLGMPPEAEKSAIPVRVEGDDELDALEEGAAVTVKLSETETMWLLSIESSCIDESSPIADDAKARNDRYQQLCKRNLLGNESLVSRDMQTVTVPKKAKESQVAPFHGRDAACQASESDIHDSAVGSVEPFLPAGLPSAAAGGNGPTAENAADENEASVAHQQQQQPSVPRGYLDKEPGTWVDVDPNDSSAEAVASRRAAELQALCESPAVDEALRMIERAVVQNEEHEKLLAYRRGLPGGKDGPPVELLWRYEAPEITEGRNVSCVAWSPFSPDTVAVGYGEFDCRKREEHTALRGRSDGLILVWSLASIHCPDHVIRTPAEVTSLAFSSRHPSLLAAGLSGGDVVVYSLAHRPATALASPSGEKRSGDPVWEVRWLEQLAEVGELLVSAGANGRVLLWGFRRGLEVKSELMRLASTPNPAKTHGAAAGSGAGALRHAGALSLDFHPSSRGIYVIATEAGLCHKCSATYNDQILQSYIGHVGPVVRVRWSPFSPSVFVSAGADWTLRLWDHDHGNAPSLTISLDPSSRSQQTASASAASLPPASTSDQSSQQQQAAPVDIAATTQHYHPLAPVPEFPNDVCWSPVSSTVLCCAAGHTLQLWDIGVSLLDPVHIVRTSGICTCAAFAPTTDVIAAGGSDGSVSIYRIRTASLYSGKGSAPAPEQRDRIEAIVSSSKQPRAI